ncbi:PH domain-containing protein [Mucilaginibacter sp. X5P1]|uniref:PH domain-containing protein n=1 Tax=Mucilaginibacter sp. X5P1 TaxID=2723088 RepID=UPI00161DAF44|nr:PH domain-containing protein [Mucilaginibacter sp. X5P1]MBB6141707.1 putative membrane protein YdbT with pleckstrin-like domain [Mucilaginibacter sp. X5P1]
MDIQELSEQPALLIKPAILFALLKTIPFVFAAMAFLYIAWHFYPNLIWISLTIMVFALYRFMYIRKIDYILTNEILRISRGIFFKRTDTIELYRIKDYILTQPPLLQVFRLMDLMLKTTDPENPVIWLRGIPLSNLVDTLRSYVQEARQRSKIVELN